jgi:hypothetical protein
VVAVVGVVVDAGTEVGAVVGVDVGVGVGAVMFCVTNAQLAEQFTPPSHCSVPSFTPFPQLVMVNVKACAESVELSALFSSATVKVLFTDI